MAEPWTPPTLPEVFGAIASHAGQVGGFRAAYYPAPSTLPLVPSLIVLAASGTIAHGPTQLWSLRVKTHLAMAMRGAAEREIQAVDGLLMPLVDAFAADDLAEAEGFTLGGLVSRCVVADWEEIGLLGYGANHRYWGLPVYFDVKLHRHATGG
jgi:hypothetical protein